MTERWTDKKRGEIGQSGGLDSKVGSLSFFRDRREDLGGLDQTEISRTIPEGTIRVKGFGAYEKVYFDPTPVPADEEEKDYRIFLHHSDSPWEFMTFNLSIHGKNNYKISRFIPSVDVESGNSPYPSKDPVNGIHVITFSDLDHPIEDENAIRDIAPATIAIGNLARHYVSTAEYSTYHDHRYTFEWSRAGSDTTTDVDNNMLIADYPYDFVPQHASTTFLMGVPTTIQGATGIVKNDMSKYGTLYNPTPFQDGSGIANDLIENNGAFISFSRKPYTLLSGKTYSDTYHEKVERGNSLTVQSQVVSKDFPDRSLSKANFFFPWIPYLHETPTLSIQSLSGTVYSEEPRPPYNYHIAYNRVSGGELVSGNILSETESFSINDTSDGNSSTATDLSTGLIDTTDINSRNITLSGSMKLYEPIFAIGIIDSCHIENTISLSGIMDESSTKIVHSAWDVGMWYWTGFCLGYPWPLVPYGIYNLALSTDYNASKVHSRAMSISQRLMFGSLEVESVSSSFSWVASTTETIHGDCGEQYQRVESPSISYTSQQMSGGEVQTLTAEDYAGCTYTWAITSGGGSLSSSSGLSVDYTAPTVNADCLQNPTITLSRFCGSTQTDTTLQLAVNTEADTTVAYRLSIPALSPGVCANAGGTCLPTNRLCSSSYYHMDCSGVNQGIEGTGQPCSACTLLGSDCDEYLYLTPLDVRTPTQKTNGCCPAALL